MGKKSKRRSSSPSSVQSKSNPLVNTAFNETNSKNSLKQLNKHEIEILLGLKNHQQYYYSSQQQQPAIKDTSSSTLQQNNRRRRRRKAFITTCIESRNDNNNYNIDNTNDLNVSKPTPCTLSPFMSTSTNVSTPTTPTKAKINKSTMNKLYSSSQSSPSSKLHSPVLDQKVIEALARHPLVYETLMSSSSIASSSFTTAANSPSISNHHSRVVSAKKLEHQEILGMNPQHNHSQENLKFVHDENQCNTVALSEIKETAAQCGKQEEQTPAQEPLKVNTETDFAEKKHDDVQGTVVGTAFQFEADISLENLVECEPELLDTTNIIEDIAQTNTAKMVGPSSGVRGYLSSIITRLSLHPTVQNLQTKVSSCLHWGLKTRLISTLAEFLSKLLAIFLVLIPTSALVAAISTFKRMMMIVH